MRLCEHERERERERAGREMEREIDGEKRGDRKRKGKGNILEQSFSAEGCALLKVWVSSKLSGMPFLPL